MRALLVFFLISLLGSCGMKSEGIGTATGEVETDGTITTNLCPPLSADLMDALEGGSGSIAKPPMPALLDFMAGIEGLSVIDAEKCVKENGLDWRIVSKDGQDFITTTDYVWNRINVVVNAGVVSSAFVG